ncbi:12222_t:CDS:1, partial [Entrophospora sp. SA101]
SYSSDIKVLLTQSTSLNVSIKTTYINLVLNSRTAETQRQKRLEWCIYRRNCTIKQIMGEEYRFTIFGSDG